MPLMWQEGLLKGGQFWQASMDSLAIDMITRMAHSAFVNSLFLGSAISKYIYTYSFSSNVVCMFYFTMNNRSSEDS